MYYFQIQKLSRYHNTVVRVSVGRGSWGEQALVIKQARQTKHDISLILKAVKKKHTFLCKYGYCYGLYEHKNNKIDNQNENKTINISLPITTHVGDIVYVYYRQRDNTDLGHQLLCVSQDSICHAMTF